MLPSNEVFSSDGASLIGKDQLRGQQEEQEILNLAKASNFSGISKNSLRFGGGSTSLKPEHGSGSDGSSGEGIG